MKLLCLTSKHRQGVKRKFCLELVAHGGFATERQALLCLGTCNRRLATVMIFVTGCVITYFIVRFSRDWSEQLRNRSSTVGRVKICLCPSHEVTSHLHLRTEVRNKWKHTSSSPLYLYGIELMTVTAADTRHMDCHAHFTLPLNCKVIYSQPSTRSHGLFYSHPTNHLAVYKVSHPRRSSLHIHPSLSCFHSQPPIT